MGHYPHISLARKTSLGLELFVRQKFHFIRISEISDMCFVWEEKKKEKVKITTPKIIFHNRKFRGEKKEEKNGQVSTDLLQLLLPNRHLLQGE